MAYTYIDNKYGSGLIAHKLYEICTQNNQNMQPNIFLMVIKKFDLFI